MKCHSKVCGVDDGIGGLDRRCELGGRFIIVSMNCFMTLIMAIRPRAMGEVKGTSAEVSCYKHVELINITMLSEGYSGTRKLTLRIDFGTPSYL